MYVNRLSALKYNRLHSWFTEQWRVRIFEWACLGYTESLEGNFADFSPQKNEHTKVSR